MTYHTMDGHITSHVLHIEMPVAVYVSDYIDHRRLWQKGEIHFDSNVAFLNMRIQSDEVERIMKQSVLQGRGYTYQYQFAIKTLWEHHIASMIYHYAPFRFERCDVLLNIQLSRIP